MMSDHQKTFLKTVAALLDARQGVVDPFFNQRFGSMADQLLESYLAYRSDCANVRGYVEILKNGSNLIEEVLYLGHGDKISLLIAQELVLRSLRDALFAARVAAVDSQKTEPIVTRKKPAEIKPIVQPKDQGLSRQKILEFVRRVSECRARDVIEEFSALSERTVKRGLKELSEEGLIVKKSENRAVYYSAA